MKSHAQKYFIKLYKEGKPLPAKVPLILWNDFDPYQVAESGAGHTLSGKPLDPNSGAALQYMGLKKKTKSEGTDKKADSQENGKENKSSADPNGQVRLNVVSFIVSANSWRLSSFPKGVMCTPRKLIDVGRKSESR